MRPVRFSGIPGRRARAAVLDNIFPKYVFIPLFIIFAAACLLLAGCTDDTVTGPDNDGNGTDDPVCSDSLPSVEIECPPADVVTAYPTTFPIVLSIEGHTAAAGIRHMLTKIGWEIDDGIEMLNENPEVFEDLWSDWETQTGWSKTIRVGEDEPLVLNQRYLFAVQVMDSCGRADSIFTHEKNARQFLTTRKYPHLTVLAKMLGTCDFWGTDQRPDPILVPSGVPLAFMWNAQKTFGCMNMEYRYGWDLQNLDDDDAWLEGWKPNLMESFERSFYSGVHVLYIEAREDYNRITRARIEIEIIPFRMERDLLWVDDWTLPESPMPNMMLPCEEVHDEFWTNICSRVTGFDPVIDIFPADELISSLDDAPIPLEVLSRYKHVIWTYSNSVENVWQNTIPFDPVPYYSGFRPNTLALYLAGGGSTLTFGRSDLSHSALASTFRSAHDMPASVLDEYESDGIAGTDPGRYSMAWDDYYVTVVDKVIARFKQGDDIPPVNRSIDFDAMMMAVEAGPDNHPGLPDTLTLWDEVTKPWMFFDPQQRGFVYVEVYDPQYYMDFRSLTSHECFSPLYLMRARSTRSPIDYAPIALTTTRRWCEHWDRPGYESYHFGFPLWFFDHDKIDQIMDYIFEQWGVD